MYELLIPKGLNFFRDEVVLIVDPILANYEIYYGGQAYVTGTMPAMIRDDVIFCATGVTDGDLVKGIRDLGDYFESETLLLHKSSKTNKIIKNKIKK